MLDFLHFKPKSDNSKLSAVATIFEAIILHTFFLWPFLRSGNSKIWFRPAISENAILKKVYGKNASNISGLQ
jgi:hypothetical protein